MCLHDVGRGKLYLYRKWYVYVPLGVRRLLMLELRLRFKTFILATFFVEDIYRDV
jgi:hypothetical protein